MELKGFGGGKPKLISQIKGLLNKDFPQRISSCTPLESQLLDAYPQRGCWCLVNHVLAAGATTTWDEGSGQALLLLHPTHHKERARTKREGREGKQHTRHSLPLSVTLQSSNLSWGIGSNEIQILNWTTQNSITIERVWKNTESTWDVSEKKTDLQELC